MIITSPAFASIFRDHSSSDVFPMRNHAVAAHRSVLLHLAAIPEEIPERWIDTFRMLIQELRDVGDAILSDKRATSSRLDVRETINDRQGIRRGIQKMPKVIIVNVPACGVLGRIVVLRLRHRIEDDGDDGVTLVELTFFQYSFPKLTIKLSPAKNSLSVSTLSSPPTISPEIHPR